MVWRFMVAGTAALRLIDSLAVRPKGNVPEAWIMGIVSRGCRSLNPCATVLIRDNAVTVRASSILRLTMELQPETAAEQECAIAP